MLLVWCAFTCGRARKNQKTYGARTVLGDDARADNPHASQLCDETIQSTEKRRQGNGELLWILLHQGVPGNVSKLVCNFASSSLPDPHFAIQKGDLFLNVFFDGAPASSGGYNQRSMWEEQRLVVGNVYKSRVVGTTRVSSHARAEFAPIIVVRFFSFHVGVGKKYVEESPLMTGRFPSFSRGS